MWRSLVGALALAGWIIPASTAGAVTVTYALTGIVTVTERIGPQARDFTGTVGRGSFSFDSAAITGTGNEVVGRGDLDIDFRIFGQSFTERADTTGLPFPALLVVDGQPRALDFFVRENGENAVPIGKPLLAGFFFDRLAPLTPTGPGAFSGEITALSAVPLPAALPLALAAAGLLAAFGRRRRA